jgi:ABC-type transporter Mla subunit MlaD
MRLAATLVVICLIAACVDRERRVLHTVLPAARDLREGAIVRYRGIDVGRVTSVRIVDTGVRLDLDIRRPDVPLRAADNVRVMNIGMFGDREVEIVPGPASAQRLSPDGWLLASPPDSLAEIRQIVSEALAKQALARVDTLIRTSHIQIHLDSAHAPATRMRP